MKPRPTDWHDALGSLLNDVVQPDIDATSEADSKPQAAKSLPRQKLRIDMERKGRGGKTATIISGFTLSDPEIADIAAMLKKRLGTGGSARGGEILIQGDRRDEARQILRDMGIIG